MAYDPKDPADKAIVDKLVSDAVEAREAELNAEHEADVKGLKESKQKLERRLRAAKAGEGDDGSDNSAEIDRLETELKTVRKSLETAERANKKLTGDLDEAKKSLDTEQAFSRNQLVEGGLRSELVKAGVAPQFQDAVLAMLKGQASVKQDGESRIVEIGGKSLGDFIKDWSSGDQGKHYIAAPKNGGADANGGQATGSGTKTMSRADHGALAPSEQSKFILEGGTLTDD